MLTGGRNSNDEQKIERIQITTIAILTLAMLASVR